MNKKYEIFNGYLYEKMFIFSVLNILMHNFKKNDKKSFKNIANYNYNKNILTDSINKFNQEEQKNLYIIKQKDKNFPLSKTINHTHVYFFTYILDKYNTEYNIEKLEKNTLLIETIAEQNAISFVKNLILSIIHKNKINNQNLLNFFDNFNLDIIYFNIDWSFQLLREYNLQSFDNSNNNRFNLSEEIKENPSKGHFLNSDLLLQINKHDNKSIDTIVNIELSFSNNVLFNISSDNNKLEEYLEILNNKLFQRLSKIKVENLKIDSNKNYEFLDGVWNTNKFDFLINKDKSTKKLIQSTSYINSYLKYLKDTHMNNNKINIKIFAYLNDELSSINITEKFDKLLEYTQQPGDRYKQLSNNEKILDNNVENINNKINNFFRKFIYNSENNTYSKILEGGDNKDFTITNLELRVKHTKIIREEYKKGNKIINLLGSPGIGKTTSLISLLYEMDNFCLIYLSSRKAVNLDILSKTKEDVSNIFSSIENKKIYNINKDINTTEYLEDLIGLTVNKQLKDENHILISKQDTADLINNALILNGTDNISYITKEEQFELKDINNRIGKISENESQINKIESNGSVFEYIKNGINDVVEHTKHRKIVATMALQGYFGENSLKKLLPFLEIISNKGIKNVIFMTDELTGAEQTSEFIKDLINILFEENSKGDIIQKKEYYQENNENILIPTELDIRLINADASISTEEALSKYLSTGFSNSKIHFKKLNTKEIENIQKLNINSPVYAKKHNNLIVKNISLNNNNTSMVNVNSYPAKQLKINYIVKDAEDKEYVNTVVAIKKEKFANMKKIKVEEIEDISSFIQSHKDTNKSVLYFLQHKDKLKEVNDLLLKNSKLLEIYKTSENIQKNILIIDNNTMATEDGIKKLKELDNYRIFLITSTASRGISFKNVTKILIDVPNFDIESQLNEIIQTIYRGRGGKYDNSFKELSFYLKQTNEDDILKKLDLLQIIFLIDGMIDSRIKGYYKSFKGSGAFNIIPNGLMGLSNQDNGNYNTDFINSLSELKKERTNTEEIQNILEEITNLTNLIIQWEGINSENEYVKNNTDIIKQLKDNLLRPLSLRFKNLDDYQKKLNVENYYDFFIEFENEGHLLNLNTDLTFNIKNQLINPVYLNSLSLKIKKIEDFSIFQKPNYKAHLKKTIEVVNIFLNNNKGRGHQIKSDISNSFQVLFMIDFFIFFREEILNNNNLPNYDDITMYMKGYGEEYFKNKNPILPVASKRIKYENNIPFIIYKSSFINDSINEKYNKNYISNINAIIFMNIINSSV